LTLSEVRLAGGAISRVPPQANAFSHRDNTLSLQMTAVTPTPEAQAKVKEHFARFKREMTPHLTGNVYINFLPGEEGRQRTREGYSLESYSRLKAVKAKYDPDNCFSHHFDLTSRVT